MRERMVALWPHKTLFTVGALEINFEHTYTILKKKKKILADVSFQA